MVMVAVAVVVEVALVSTLSSFFEERCTTGRVTREMHDFSILTDMYHRNSWTAQYLGQELGNE